MKKMILILALAALSGATNASCATPTQTTPTDEAIEFVRNSVTFAEKVECHPSFAKTENMFDCVTFDRSTETQNFVKTHELILIRWTDGRFRLQYLTPAP